MIRRVLIPNQKNPVAMIMTKVVVEVRRIMMKMMTIFVYYDTDEAQELYANTHNG